MTKAMTGRSLIAALAAVASLYATSLATAPTATAQEYRYMSCGELWYARNAIYARRGYCFETARARSVFGRRCYPPFGRLRSWERAEVSRIQRWERRKGC